MEKNQNILVVSLARLDAIVIETFERKTGLKCIELFQYTVPTRVSSLKRHMDCIKLAFRVVTLRNKYKTIVFWQQFIGLYFNLWCYVLFVRKYPQAIILTVIYIKRYGYAGKIFYFFFKLAFNSKYVDKLVCHSSNERIYYLDEFGHNLANKIIFCRLGEGLNHKDCIPIPEEKYFFSGGSSNRDYTTLIKAFEGLDQRLIIACKPENIITQDIPSNVTVVCDAYGVAFSNLIRNSYAVILTIQNPNISSGQLVLLNAMSFGKCLIVTAGNCMYDYINDDYSISVPAKSAYDIREAVNFLLENPDQYRQMSVDAYNNYQSLYSVDKYAERIADLVKN
jgi:glycosyltransferase involved in cell wall biosynthesis